MSPGILSSARLDRGRGLLSLLLLATIVLTFDCRVGAQENNQNHRLEKLTAFAKTFGYARYFHPSDQASLVDWDKMAVFGAAAAMSSPADETCEALLSRIFSPLIVDLEFYRGQEKPRPETKDVPMQDILAWQHRGVGINAPSPFYKSGRTNRTEEVAVKASPFGNLVRSVDATELRGKEIRFRFHAKSVSPKCRLQGWLRVDRESGKLGLFDNMGDRPITSEEWAEYEISGTVDEDAERMTFGVMFIGIGTALVDKVTLQQKSGNSWAEVELENSDFEMGRRRPDAWGTHGIGYTFELDSDDRASGKKSLRITRGTNSKKGGILDTVPKLGEVIDSAIVGDLRVRMPLALPADLKYSTGDNPGTDSLVREINGTKIDGASQDVLCAANVVIAWNIFQHFYTYFEQVDTDWPATLQSSLDSAVRAESSEDTTRTLQWLVAQLHDGHGRVVHPDSFRNVKYLPARFEWIENQLVVVASHDDRIKVGDVVSHIGEVKSVEYLADVEVLISGSPQWKRYRSTSELSRSNDLEALSLKILRGDEETTVELKFGTEMPPATEKREMIDQVVKGDDPGSSIYYVDMARVKPEDVRPMLNDFAKAKGIVFDMRGYPKGTQFLFQHMSDEHMQSAKWQVPEQIRPDRVDIKEIETMGRWEMPPIKPRFQGEFVFITNGSAISYAESCMAIVAHYQLAEIIGSPTAGANGNVNPFVLPGGYRVSWTGMRVMNHDDSQHHVRGVQPTIPMQPTIQGIREGRDELFEKALELVKGDAK